MGCLHLLTTTVGMYSTPHSGGYSPVVPPKWGVLGIRGGYNTTPHGTPQNGAYSGVLFSRWGYYLKSLESKSAPQDGAYSGVLEPMVAGIVEALRFKASSPPPRAQNYLPDPICRWEIAFMN